MRRLTALALLPMLISAGQADPVAQARADAAASEAQAQRLEAAAAKAGDEVTRIREARAAAAARVTAAEAQLAVAVANQSALQQAADASAAKLAEAQRPATLLLAGLVQLGRRPPLLAIADNASLQEFVRARALLDASLPVIRSRSAALAAQVAANRRLAQAAAGAAPELERRRQALIATQDRFAALERRADARLAALGAAALEAGDRALARGEGAEDVAERQARERGAGRLASALAAFPEAATRPTPGDSVDGLAKFAWRLPANAPVTAGLAEVSDSGVRSRGLTLATGRGTAIVAPAAGRIVFSGPFRRHEGVVIIDHGDGWMTMLTEVRSSLETGTSLGAGDALGRALGPVGVELRHRGVIQPAALIASSSAALSKGGTAR